MTEDNLLSKHDWTRLKDPKSVAQTAIGRQRGFSRAWPPPSPAASGRLRQADPPPHNIGYVGEVCSTAPRTLVEPLAEHTEVVEVLIDGGVSRPVN
jgi:hypothetical protein